MMQVNPNTSCGPLILPHPLSLLAPGPVVGLLEMSDIDAAIPVETAPEVMDRESVI